MTQSPIEQAREALERAIVRSIEQQHIPETTEDSQARRFIIEGMAQDIVDALTALRQHQQGGGWRDISTAPKDGTWIMLWFPPTKTASYVSKKLLTHGTSHIGRYDDLYAGGTWIAYPGEQRPIAKPTHWQPLPPAPKKENDDG